MLSFVTANCCQNKKGMSSSLRDGVSAGALMLTRRRNGDQFTRMERDKYHYVESSDENSYHPSSARLNRTSMPRVAQPNHIRPHGLLSFHVVNAHRPSTIKTPAKKDQQNCQPNFIDFLGVGL
jgi:hypothetical protein